MAIFVYTLLERQSPDHDAQKDLQDILDSFYQRKVLEPADLLPIPQEADYFDTQDDAFSIEAVPIPVASGDLVEQYERLEISPIPMRTYIEDTSMQYKIDGVPGFVDSKEFPFPDGAFLDSLLPLCKYPMKLNEHPQIRELGLTNDHYRFGIAWELCELFMSHQDEEFTQRKNAILSLEARSFLENKRQEYMDRSEFKGIKLAEEEKKLRSLNDLLTEGTLTKDTPLPTERSLRMITYLREKEATQEYKAECAPQNLLNKARQSYLDNHKEFHGIDLLVEEQKMQKLKELLNADEAPDVDLIPSKKAAEAIKYMKQLESSEQYKEACDPAKLLADARQRYVDAHPDFQGMDLLHEEKVLKDLNSRLICGEVTSETPLPTAMTFQVLEYARDVIARDEEFSSLARKVDKDFDGFKSEMIRALKEQMYGDLYVRAEEALQGYGYVLARIKLQTDSTVHTVQDLLSTSGLPSYVIIDEGKPDFS